MNVGQLTATYDIDATGAEEGIARQELALRGLERNTNATAASIKRDMEAALRRLPNIRITADSTEADLALDEVKHQLRDLAAEKVGVTISAEDANARLTALQERLVEINRTTTSPQVTAGTRQAYAALDVLQARLTEMAAEDHEVTVTLEARRAWEEAQRLADEARTLGNEGEGVERDWSRLGNTLSSVGGVLGAVAARVGMVAAGVGAAVPPLAGVVAMLGQVAPVAGVAVSGLLMVASAAAAIKIGTSGIGSAIKAAFAEAPAAAGAATNSARQFADAQRAVADASENAAYANQQAAQRVTDAERNLTDSQKAALAAQQALTDARKQAAMDLEDLQDRLTDSSLSQREAMLRVQSAQDSLNQTLKNPAATQQQRDQAQLTYDQAVQHLREQGTAYERLKVQAAEAARAGVDGSKTVKSAQDQLALAQRQVGDQTRAVTDAQVQQARTAKQGAEQVAKAIEALQQAGASAAGGGVDPLAAALAKLSPNARSFVEELIRLKPALSDLKFEVQQRLFAGLDSELARAAGTVLPVLRGSLAETAGQLNLMAKGGAEAGVQVGESGVLGRALASANRGLGNLVQLPGQIVTGLFQIGAAAGPAFERVTSGAGRLADRVSARLSSALSSGGLERAISGALDLLGQLGTVVVNVGSILGSVLGAANANGGSFVQTLVTITGALAQAFASPEVQEGLSALYSTMGLLARIVGPLLAQALKALGPVLAALAPGAQALIQALGPALSVVIRALGPVMTSLARAVSSIAVALAPVLTLIGNLVAALLPVLTPLLDGVAQIASQLAPLIAALADALGSALTPILAQLPGILGPFVQILTSLTGSVLPILTQLIVALSPSIGMLAQAFGQVMQALAPVLQQLAVMIGQQMQVMLPLLPPLVKAIGQLAAIFAGNLAQALTGIVVPALRMLSQLLSGDVIGAAHSAGDVLRGVADLVVREFLLMPGQVVSVLDDMADQMFTAGGRIVLSLADGIRSKAYSVAGSLAGVLQQARDYLPFSPARKGPFSGAGWTLHSGRSISSALADGILSGQGRVQAAAASLMGAAHAPIGGVGQLAFAGASFAASPARPGGGLHIEHYHESESGSARSTAEELNWLAKGRG